MCLTNQLHVSAKVVFIRLVIRIKEKCTRTYWTEIAKSHIYTDIQKYVAQVKKKKL